MPTTQPKEARLLQLHNELFKLRDKDTNQLNEVAAQKIKKETVELEAYNPAIANIILGILESLKGNKHASEKHHKISIRLLPGEDSYYQYSISMGHLGYFQESYQLMQKAIQHNSTIPSYLAAAVEIAIRTGHVNKALDYYQKISKLIPDTDNELSHLMKKLNKAQRLVNAGFKDKDIVEITQAVEDVCHEFDARIVSSWLMEDPEEPGDYTDWLYIDKPSEITRKMGDAVFHKLRTDKGLPPLYIYGYSPFLLSATDRSL